MQKAHSFLKRIHLVGVGGTGAGTLDAGLPCGFPVARPGVRICPSCLRG